MARPLRIQFEGAFYHVLNRGLERKTIFRTKSDYETFLKLLRLLHSRFDFKVHSYCLMPNHYHLYLETPKPNLSRFMRELNGVYTQDFNRRHKRVGPLFQGRYKAILVDRDNYSLELSRYIHLNPIKAKLANTPEDYPWSSYAIFHKAGKSPAFMDTSFILSQFKSLNSFRKFTLEGLNQNWEPFKNCHGGYFLGTDEFVEEMKEKFLPKEKDSSIANLKMLQKPKDVSIFKQKIKLMTTDLILQKKLLVYALKAYTPLSLKEISKELGENLSQSAISQIYKRFLEEEQQQGYQQVNQLKNLSNVKT